jgi:hypothetical protein
MSISISQYVGVHDKSLDWTQTRRRSAETLLLAVNNLMAEAALMGVDFAVNPKTRSQISGSTFGGFRPQNCPIGAPNSNHKQGLAVDLFDPHGSIGRWCLANQAILVRCGIWLEHPSATPTWSHWQSVAPRSGNRFFMP